LRPLFSALAQTYCPLEEAGLVLAEVAVVTISKNPLLNDRIGGGKLRLRMEEERVRAQDFTNFQIGSVRGDPNVGDVKIYLMLT